MIIECGMCEWKKEITEANWPTLKDVSIQQYAAELTHKEMTKHNRFKVIL